MIEIFKSAVRAGASDLHLKTGDVLRARINGDLVPLTQNRLTQEQIRQVALQLIPHQKDRDRVDDLTDYDCSWGLPGVGRFRVNMLRQRGTLMIVLRVIPFEIPTFEQLDLPRVLAEISMHERGLVLVTGVTGSGKSTTLAAMIGHLNANRRRHIITLENPIEFLHRDNQSSITQREIGTDTISFETGLRAALREDPDVILIGEMRDTTTIDTALKESIRRDPSEVATAIFPVLGPAIRKAIAETMAGLVRSINAAVEQSLSINGLKWRIESWRTGVPYPEIVIKHALIYRVEQVFLVHTETGLLLEHVAAEDLKVPDADLISSMLSAIQDFVRDSFEPTQGGTLRMFSVGDHTVQVEAGPRALLAVVIRGQAPDTVLRRQQDTLEAVHLEFASQLGEDRAEGRAQLTLEGNEVGGGGWA